MNSIACDEADKLGLFEIILKLDPTAAMNLAKFTDGGNPQALVLSVKGQAVVAGVNQAPFHGDGFYLTTNTLDEARRTADFFERQLNLITGPNGSRKSNLYRALRLLAETASGGVVGALAREGGLTPEAPPRGSGLEVGYSSTDRESRRPEGDCRESPKRVLKKAGSSRG